MNPDFTTTYTCPVCGTVFERYTSQTLESGVALCGKECTAIWKRGKKTKPHKLTVSDEQIITEYQAGASCTDLARKYGMSDTGIAYRLKINGIERRKFKASKDQTSFEPTQIPDSGIAYPREADVSGIYQIICITTGKFYVGSASCLRRRRNDHLRALRDGNHPNIHLQRTWNKYGETSFKFQVIELCNSDTLVEREQHFIDTLNPELNIARDVQKPMLGTIRTRESIEKSASKIRGVKKSEEHKRKIAEAHKGKPISDEHRKSISETLKNSDYRGEQSSQAKLTETDVIEIRRLRAEGMTIVALGKMFGVYHSAISAICLRKTWKHIP